MATATISPKVGTRNGPRWMNGIMLASYQLSALAGEVSRRGPNGGRLFRRDCALGPWVPGANVRRKLFVALAFEDPLHRVESVATRRTRRLEYPRALRATPSQTVSGFDPSHLPHGPPLNGVLFP